MPRSPATQDGSFVVHLHLATRTHYDLRLEVAGILKSFAVPRGPSLHPDDRRLAVETEDHPLEYLEYEGVIPKGNYGAGPMILWDTGQVQYLERPAEEGLTRGKLDFVLFGYKLRGRFALVLSQREVDAKDPNKRHWLLIKKQDAYARKDAPVEENPRSVLSGLTAEELEVGGSTSHTEALARTYGAERHPVTARGLVPMLCADVDPTIGGADDVLNRANWLFELKLDGVRVIADKAPDQVALWSRRGPAVSQSYPEIVRAVRALPGSRLVLDGEIVAFDANGKPSFSRVARRIHARYSDVWQLTRDVPVTYVVFDLLAIDGLDLRSLPIVRRKELLKQIVRGRGFVRCLDHFEGAGHSLYDFCCSQQLEGVVAKRMDSPYRPGPRRTGDWVKVKCHKEAEFVIVGLTHGEGARFDLGAIDLASYHGDDLIVRGKVGSGLDPNSIALVLDQTRERERPTCAASGRLEPAPHGRRFVEPRTVVRVRFTGWTEEGRLRHPVFLGIRNDVAPKECTSRPPDEVLDVPPEQAPELPSPSRDVGSALRSDAVRTDPTGAHRVPLTHANKVFWPADGITKGQLVEYYEQVADVILPYLRHRPVILVRYPDGIEGKSFYQWNVPDKLPSWVQTLELPPENGQGRAKQGFLINDVSTLKYIVNLGCIPVHILASRGQSLETCDFITLDLDIDASSLLEAIRIAHTLRALVEGAGLDAYVKTSGQSGLHLLIPLGPGISYPAARLLVELLGRLAIQRHPDTATMERRKEKRGPRVYVDTGQTGPSRSIVAPYSVRAVPGATVSTPLTWDEVTPALEVERYTLLSVPKRLETRGDPMRDLLTREPKIGNALRLLEGVVRGGPERAGTSSRHRS